MTRRSISAFRAGFIPPRATRQGGFVLSGMVYRINGLLLEAGQPCGNPV